MKDYKVVVNQLRESDMKFDKLCRYLEELESLVVAFSGGVDSTFLMVVATAVLGDEVTALTVNAPYIADWEIDEAIEISKDYGINHQFLEANVIDAIKFNPENRCYMCKTAIFTNIKAFAEAHGLKYVVDGSNFDDTKDYRPGMKALKELGIKSPMLECEVTKAEIRAWSKALDLSTWDKPPYACLLTRLPYGTEIIAEDLRMIEKSEFFLMQKGIKAVRVRKQGDLARIEIAESEFEKILDKDLMRDISTALKSFGFKQVTLDLEGYRMGSFNETIESLK